MDFDVSSYCKRLANADPERFLFNQHGGVWFLREKDYDGDFMLMLDYGSSMKSAWAFIGPLADELGIDMIDRGYHDEGQQGVPDERYEYDSLLEAVFAAVVEKLESAKEEAV